MNMIFLKNIIIFIIVFSSITSCNKAVKPEDENRKTDSKNNVINKQETISAMSCFIRYQWFEGAMAAKSKNIPITSLLKLIKKQLNRENMTDWRKSAEFSVAMVFSGDYTNAEYAKLATIIVDDCLEEKNIIKYSAKFKSCIIFSNIAREIYWEKDKGTSLSKTESLLEGKLKNNKINIGLVKDIFKTEKTLSHYRTSVWAGCSSNIRE